jgi:hypothetical protein
MLNISVETAIDNLPRYTDEEIDRLFMAIKEQIFARIGDKESDEPTQYKSTETLKF